MEISTNAIYDRAKENWTQDIISKQLAKNNNQTTITFTDNINFINENATSGQIHFVIATGLKSMAPIVCIHKKLLLNNGNNILISEFIQFTENKQKDFTDKANWFNFNEFEIIIDQMNWIKNVRINQGTKGVMNMSIDDFKKFTNTTFKTKFKIKNIENNNNGNDNNNNNNNNNKNNEKDKQNSKFKGRSNLTLLT